MTQEELECISEEIVFWENNMFDICIRKRMPEKIPDNQNVKQLLLLFEEERDYYALVRRLNELRGIKKNTSSFIEKN
ncbi:MAG TPA: hypothetical protein VI112_10225 [Bacteroidia bacterium]|jgi:hypothetical protein